MRNLAIGDRVVIPSPIACGYCIYCRPAISRNATMPTRTGVALVPSTILTRREPLLSAVEAFKAFDRREPGWLKVALLPAAA